MVRARYQIVSLVSNPGISIDNWTKIYIPSKVKYLSPATSTFILRVSRAHYRIVWAALSFMDVVPVTNGRSCNFRVVRVSGTIRKVEEEAIRRAREILLRARNDVADQASKSLDKVLGKVEETHLSVEDEEFEVFDTSQNGKEHGSDGDG